MNSLNVPQTLLVVTLAIAVVFHFYIISMMLLHDRVKDGTETWSFFLLVAIVVEHIIIMKSQK